MREIVFRGKDTDSGKWKYGDLLRATYSGETLCWVMEGKSGWKKTSYAVDPGTVGQFTGLLDRCGQRIFEGDIIRAHGRSGELWEIRWIEKYARFAAWKPRTVFAVFAFEQGEVVGNVHDNPELLKGGAAS